MPWNSTTLRAAMGKTFDEATSALDEVSSLLDKADQQLTKINSDLNSLVNAATISSDLVNKVTQSGFYMIILSPRQGSWSTRMLTAENAPPTSGYSMGHATISVTADLGPLLDAYNNMVEALTTPLKFDSIFNPFNIDVGFQPFDPSSLIQFTVPSIELPDEDVWVSGTLGTLFTGFGKAAVDASNKAASAARGVGDVFNQVKKRGYALNKCVDDTQGVIDNATNTGVYSIILPPAVGGYIGRLEGEIGAPPNLSSYYTSGFAIFAIASGISDLLDKYDALLEIVGS